VRNPVENIEGDGKPVAGAEPYGFTDDKVN